MSAITDEMVEAGVEEISKAKHTCFDRWTDHDAIRAVLEASVADTIAALSAENDRLRKALQEVQSAQSSNHGCMATILSDISKIAASALEAKPEPRPMHELLAGDPSWIGTDQEAKP